MGVAHINTVVNDFLNGSSYIVVEFHLHSLLRLLFEEYIRDKRR